MLLGILSVAAMATSACSSVAPGPAAATPAPTLPADSIAYDQLPIHTDRPNPFSGDCSQIAANQALLSTLQVNPDKSELQVPKNASNDCVLVTTAGDQIDIALASPRAGHPDPWQSSWNAPSPGFYPSHFRRLIVLGRYYAVSQVVDTNLIACEIDVQTGSPAVFSVAYRSERFANADLVANPQQATTIGEQLCPQAQRVAELVLTAIDPGGGSLAAP